MHTALQLGVRVAAKARAAKAQVGFFGLYATLNAAHLRERHGEFVAGENAEELVELARSIEEGRVPQPVVPAETGRGGPFPRRAAGSRSIRQAVLERRGAPGRIGRGLPGMQAPLRHCPIVPCTRDGFVAVPRQTVLADIEQQLERGGPPRELRRPRLPQRTDARAAAGP